MDEGELVPDVDEGTKVKVTQEVCALSMLISLQI